MHPIRSLAIAAATAALAFSTPAAADAITFDSGDIGQTFTLTYDGFADGQTIQGLTATTTLKLTEISGTAYKFDYTVTNTTSEPVNSRISSFGFDTDPDFANASSTGTFNFVDTNQNVPNQGVVDVCFKAGGSNSCSGSGGVLSTTTGNTGSGMLTLSFASAPSMLTISDFFVRYQSITGAGNVTSATGQGTVTSSGSTGGTPVPEPEMLGLLGLALIALGFARRRRQPSLVPGAMPLPA